MLVSISEVFDIPVSVLLGENIKESKDEELKVISEKLEIINQQLYQRQELKKINSKIENIKFNES